ncbi:hypothetical protein DL771_001193 [Monosporascus sp. 5C6A]|nr:hypothetical protein DL771_001193 [Monosporascus sp. 5C6A]
MRNALALAALFRATSGLHSVAVRSNNPYDCDPINGIDIAFSEDRNKISAKFRTIELTVYPPVHGNPGGFSIVSCGASVEFKDRSPHARLAIENVTWHVDNLNLTGNNNLYGLAAKVDMRVAHLTNYYPTKYPLVFDYAASTLLDLDVDPGIGNDSYQGEFVYFANSNLEWSTCFGGYLANTTSIDFALSDRTEKGGTSAPGWSMELDLAWEECYPSEEQDWGQVRHKNWEICSFEEAGSELTRRKRCDFV